MASNWRDDPATLNQKTSLRNTLDKRYGIREGLRIWEEIMEKNPTKGQLSDLLGELYKKK